MSWSFLIWHTLFHLIRGKNINHNRARLCTLPDTWISEPKQLCIKSDQDTQPSGQDFWFKKSDYNRFGEQLLCLLWKEKKATSWPLFSCTTSTPIQAEFFRHVSFLQEISKWTKHFSMVKMSYLLCNILPILSSFNKDMKEQKVIWLQYCSWLEFSR